MLQLAILSVHMHTPYGGAMVQNHLCSAHFMVYSGVGKAQGLGGPGEGRVL